MDFDEAKAVIAVDRCAKWGYPCVMSGGALRGGIVISYEKRRFGYDSGSHL